MSSHNILQLMTHLNDFEITINNVICEFATRLSALIDANFFLILENRDGRKLCGSTGLVDQYVRGTLRPLDTDQIATFDPKVTGNHFVHLATATSNTDVGDDVEGRGSHGGVVGGSGGGGGNGLSASNPTMKLTPFDTLDLSCDDFEEEQKTPLGRGRRRKRKSVVAVENGFDNIGNDEEARSTRKKSRMTYDEFGNFEDDVCIVDDDGDPEPVFKENHDDDDDPPCVIEDTGTLIPVIYSPTRARGKSIENVLALDPNLTTEDFQLDIETLNLPFNKIQVLQSLEDPAPIFLKDSVEFKLASSILYDFGKELASVCPYSTVGPPDSEEGVKAKVFFHQNFKSFIGLFPCLKSELIQNIRIAKKSAEAHMKNNARAGFNSVFDKRKKDSSSGGMD